MDESRDVPCGTPLECYPSSPPKDSVVTDALSNAFAAVNKFQSEAFTSLLGYRELIPAVSQHAERSLKQLALPEPPKAIPVDWVFAIDIATRDFGKGDNIERRLGELHALAPKTKGKPVAISVQVAVQDLKNDSNTPASLYKFFVPTPYHIDRYVIHDGEMKKVDSVNSAGYGGDVKNLLSFTSTRFSPEKSGMLVDSHGNGNLGLSGDIGKVTIPHFTSSIKEGWKGSKQLDLIDLDSCLMAQVGVLDSLRGVTRHVVASAETERALGQDLTQTLNAIIDNPKISPSELGELIVENARMQRLPRVAPAVARPTNFYELIDSLKPIPKDKVPECIQVRTLAHFDLANFDRYGKELDKLGDALVEAIKDPKNRRFIDSLIEDAPSYGDWFGEPGEAKDMKVFVDRIFKAIADKEMTDPQGDLRIHGGRLADAHKKLVESFSGFDQYGARGGLSAYLPERYFLDFHKRAKNNLVATDFVDDCNDVRALSKDKAKYLERLNKTLKAVDKEIEAAKDKDDTSDTEIDQVSRIRKSAGVAVDTLNNASGLKETLTAMDQLKTVASDLFWTKFYQRKLGEKEIKSKKDIDEAFAAQLVDSNSGWGRFRIALRRLD